MKPRRLAGNPEKLGLDIQFTLVAEILRGRILPALAYSRRRDQSPNLLPLRMASRPASPASAPRRTPRPMCRAR